MWNCPVFCVGPQSPQCNCYLFSTGIATHTVLECCIHPLSSEHECWNGALEIFLFHSKLLNGYMIHANVRLLLLTQTDRHGPKLRKTSLTAKAARISHKSFFCWLSKASNHSICARALLLLLLERQLCLPLSQTSTKLLNKISLL